MKLVTMKELMAEIPVSCETIKRHLKICGYKKTFHKYLFTPLQAQEIKDYFTCSKSFEGKEALTGTRAGRSTASALLAQQARQRRKMQSALRESMKTSYSMEARP